MTAVPPSLHRFFRFSQTLVDLLGADDSPVKLSEKQREGIETYDRELEDFLSDFLISTDDDGNSPITSTDLWHVVSALGKNFLEPTTVPEAFRVEPTSDMNLDPGGDLNMSVGGIASIETGTDFNLIADQDMNLSATRDANVGGGRDLNLGAGSGHAINFGDSANLVIRIGDKVNFSQQASATGPVGTVIGKVPVYNSSGVLSGYFPIYDTIT